MGKIRLNKDIILNFCNTDYSGNSCYVEEELHSSYLELYNFCKKYKLEVGKIIPIYNTKYLILNAVVSEPNSKCTGKTLKNIIKEINRLNKEGIVRFVQPNIHIYQKLPDKIKDYLIKELNNFNLTFN